MSVFISVSGETWVYFDCDDTLVMWNDKRPAEVVIENPYNPTEKISLYKHERHIKELIEFKEQGHTVVVWSRGGKLWADAVVDALGLRQYVNYTLQKPQILYDDEAIKQWLPHIPRWRDDKRE